MLYTPLFVLLLMVLLNVIFRIASLLRLAVPILYAVIVPVFFPDWLHENETLVTMIFFVLVGLVALSWVVTIRKKIRSRRNQPDSMQG